VEKALPPPPELCQLNILLLLEAVALETAVVALGVIEQITHQEPVFQRQKHLAAAVQ
jgi:hypothetical protein